MKVFFTCSHSGKEFFQKEYDLVIDTILACSDVELITPERDPYLDYLPKKIKSKLKNKEKIHYESIKRLIFESDVVIIDNSHQCFRLGHEASLAIQYNKPTLVLSCVKDVSNFINHNNFFGAKYNKYNIKSIIENFLKEAERNLLNVRFNMFISEDQKDFLEKQATANGMSKSEYLRKLINIEMQPTD